MSFSKEEMEIVKSLVGNVTCDMAEIMENNLECFFHKKVTVFIPSKGQCPYAISPSHTHPAYLFTYCLQPFYDIVVEGKETNYNIKDDISLSAISPMIIHQEKEADTFQSYIAIVIEKEAFEKVFSEYSDKLPVFKGELYKPKSELLSVLHQFMVEERKYKNHGLLDNMSEIIIHTVVRSVINDCNENTKVYNRFEVDKAIGYMTRNISEKITLETLSKYVNVSNAYFSKMFKEVTGQSPIEFLNYLRIKKAKVMLIDESLSITDIALECGFKSSAYFSTCFTEKYKITPSAYRKSLSNKI